MIRVKRIYDLPAPDDGERILVDRLWPRGVSKEKANFDLWLKEIAPSPELRKWFGHDLKKWHEFQHRYKMELHNSGLLEKIPRNATLLTATKSKQNHAQVLRDLLSK